MQDQNSTTVAAQPVDDPFDDEALSELRDVRDRLLPLDVLEGLSPEHQFTLVDRVWLCDDSDRRYEAPPRWDQETHQDHDGLSETDATGSQAADQEA